MAIMTAPPSVGELRERTERRLERATEMLADLRRRGAPYTQQTFLEPLNDIQIELSNAQLDVSLLKEVHPEPEVRQTCEELQLRLSRFATELQQDRDIYKGHREIDVAALDPHARRFVELARMDMRRAGVELPDAGRDRAKELRQRMVQLAQEYARILREDVRTVELDPSELEGLPEDYIRAHPGGPDGNARITTNPPDTTPFLSYAKSERARRAVAQAMADRASDNIRVFGEMRRTRHQYARLLGYDTWADYNTEDKMAGSARSVREFLDRVRDAARRSAEIEFGELLAQKRTELPDAATIGTWESAYYTQQLRSTKYAFDARAARPYFEYRTVRQAILDLNSELFGLEFRKVEDPEAWHPSVETFEVRVRGELRGRISLDMHPRDGKNKWFYCTTKTAGIAGKQLHHGVLVCNFPDPAERSGGALMDHSEVVTYFHEFGHLIHGIAAGKARWLRILRPAENDFMEAPSRFLEEYIFDYDVLRRFARHVETGEPISEELVRRLRAARDFGRAVRVENGAYLASLALSLHDRDPSGIDPREAAKELRRRYTRFVDLPRTNFPVNWEHMSNDMYSASYYTYLWSETIARDLCSGFTKGLLDPKQTRRYFDLVLGQGGTKPAAELVKDFLGRPYTFEAFKEWLRPTA